MATSKIKRPGAQLAYTVKSGSLSAYKNQSTENLVQVIIESDAGKYVLQTSNTGIELRDVSNNNLIHKVNWTT